MPNSRAVLLLRRLSNEAKLKNLSLNTNTKDVFVANQRDFCWSIRASTLSKDYNLNSKQLTRRLSDKIKNMATANTESNSEEKPVYTNRLIHEKSPYLLQHAHNPVNWYPWGEEALEKAKKEDKLIFLSVGYAACHWCHVMEEESFLNEEVAAVLNENFVCIKMDREERPDIDRLYMMYVLVTTGQGGWPMNIFLTPNLLPLFGGTYFPPEDLWGFKGLKSLCYEAVDKWNNDREEFIYSSEKVLAIIRNTTELHLYSTSVPGEKTWMNCVQKYIRIYEPEFGGFGPSPKFPQGPALHFLFHFYSRDKNDEIAKQCLDMCLHSLTKMAKGGIHDQIGGGFSRYATDDQWHVPHFEKMLYDQAQLVSRYCDAYLATKDEHFAEIARDIIKYVNRDLRHEEGGYYSAEDADSYPFYGATDKMEGAFYVWEYEELKSILPKKSINSMSYFEIFCNYYNVEETGNVPNDFGYRCEFENKNILIAFGSELEAIEKIGTTKEKFREIMNDCKDALMKARKNRPRPDIDTKMLCSWNALMVAGLAYAGQCLEDDRYIDDAIKTANFIKKYLYNEETGTLIHACYKDKDGSVVLGNKPIVGLLDDYAYLVRGLLDLYEATFDRKWLVWGRELQSKQNELFWDREVGGYFNGLENEPTPLRLKSDQDCAEPCGNSIACQNLQRLSALADKDEKSDGGDVERDMAKKMLIAFTKRMNKNPNSVPEMMSALMLYNDSPTQIMISGRLSDPRTQAMARAARARLLPGRVLSVSDPDTDPPVLNRKRTSDDKPTAYVCRRYSCSLPITDVKQLEELLDEPAIRNN